MCTAALITAAKTRNNRHVRQQVEGKTWHTHATGYYSATEKNEMVSSAATWTDLEMDQTKCSKLERKDTV